MQTFNAIKKNGVALAESITLSLDPEKIVYTQADGGDCEILYAPTTDRRIKPTVYTVTNTKTTVDGIISGTQIALVVTNQNDATTVTRSVQVKYIDEIKEAYAIINKTKTACRQVIYWKGAFLSDTVYVTNSLASMSTAIVTTTTTTAAATTTTTAGD